MYLQVRLPLACLLIVAYAFFTYTRKGRLRTYSARIFEMMVVCGIIHIASAVVTEYTVNNRDTVAEWYNYLWHIIFLLSLSLTCILIYYYLIVNIEKVIGKRKRIATNVGFAVCGLSMLGQILLPIKYVDTEYGSYSYGMKAYSLYVVVVYCMVMMLVELIRYRKILEDRLYHILLYSVIVFVIVSAIQIVFPYMLLTSFATAMIMVGIMMSTADAHLFVNYKTGLYNDMGCREILKELLLGDGTFKLGVYVLFGDRAEINAAAISLKEQAEKVNPKMVCGMPSDNIFIIFPLVGHHDIHGFGDRLPSPENEPSVSFVAKCLWFECTQSLDEVFRELDDFRSRSEESVLQSDELTGLMRRTVYSRKVNQIVAEGRGFSFLMIDIDDFKEINDTYGHTIGDEVLRLTAETFRTTLRVSDLICRMGGDEFSIILSGIVEPEHIEEIAARFIKKLKNARIFGEHDIPIKLSMGVKVHRAGEPAVTFDQLYIESDAALYRAKKSGKDRIVLCE